MICKSGKLNINAWNRLHNKPGFVQFFYFQVMCTIPTILCCPKVSEIFRPTERMRTNGFPPGPLALSLGGKDICPHPHTRRLFTVLVRECLEGRQGAADHVGPDAVCDAQIARRAEAVGRNEKEIVCLGALTKGTGIGFHSLYK